jgi:DNA-binding response OmpR family regulator
MKDNKILHVEADENAVLMLAHAFARAGLVNPVRVVHDGRQAIDYLAGNGVFFQRRKYPRVRIVLLSLDPPKVSGLKVLAWIRRQTERERLRVGVLVPAGNRADVKKVRRLGADFQFAKPRCYEEWNELAEEMKGILK